MMNYPRRNYEMTQENLNKILNACRPVPMIMIGGFVGQSQQERANSAWAELGSRMGFDHMTVEPTGRGDRFFTAIPLETEEQRKTREADEAATKRTAELTMIRAEIAERQKRLEALEA